VRPDCPIRRSCTFSKEHLHMCKLASRWVPHSLTEIQKWQQYESARMQAYKPEMKRQSNEWRHYRSPRKPKYSRIPAMLRLWSFSPTTVQASSSHMLWPSIGQSQASTTSISWSIICAVRCGRPYFLGENTPIILHNARPHVADVVNQLLVRWQWEVLYHPLYSPDISPCDFDLIPKVKEPLRGRHFRLYQT